MREAAPGHVGRQVELVRLRAIAQRGAGVHVGGPGDDGGGIGDLLYHRPACDAHWVEAVLLLRRLRQARDSRRERKDQDEFHRCFRLCRRRFSDHPITRCLNRVYLLDEVCSRRAAEACVRPLGGA